MSLTALNKIAVSSTPAALNLTADVIGDDLSQKLSDFLGVANPALTAATGSLALDILKIKGTFAAFIDVSGVLTLSNIKATIFLFDVPNRGLQERHCLFLTESIVATDFTPLNLLKCYTPEGAAPGFLNGTANAFLSNISFGPAETAAAVKQKLLFSSLDYTQSEYATAPCPVLTDSDTKSFCDTAKITTANLFEGFTFYMQPSLQNDLLTDLELPTINAVPLTTSIRPTYYSFDLHTTYTPTGASVPIGDFSFSLSSMTFIFDLQFPNSIYPSIAILGTAAIGTSTINYHLDLNLGGKSIAIRFTDFPSFADLAASLTKADSSFNLEDKIGGNLPLPAGSNITDKLGTITIHELQFNASFSASWGITYLGMRVGTSKPLSFIDGVMAIQPSIEVQLWYPFTKTKRHYDFKIGGLWILGSGPKAVQLSTIIQPSGNSYMLFAELANGSSINITDLVSYAIPDESLKKQLPNLSVLDLELTADFATKSFELEIDFFSDWVLTVPNTSISIALKGLEFYISIVEKKVAEFTLNGYLSFAQLELMLEGSYDSEDGWFFRASVSPGAINLASLFKKISSSTASPPPGEDAALKDFPKLGKGASPATLMINGLYVEYRRGLKPADNTPPASSFSFFAALDTNVPLIPDKVVLDNVMARFEYDKPEGATKAILSGEIYAEFAILDSESGEQMAGIMLGAKKNKDGSFIFKGGTAPGQQIPIGKLLAALAKKIGGENIPIDAISNFTIDQLHLEYNTKTKKFQFNCEALYPLDENNPEEVAQARLNIEYTAAGKGQYSRHIEAAIIIDGLEFALTLDGEKATDHTSSTVLGTFVNTENKDIHLKNLIATLSPDVADFIPAGFSVSLKDLFFARYKITKTLKSGKLRTFSGFIFGAELAVHLSLNDLPLVGKKLPANANMGVHDLKLVVSSANFSHTNLGSINSVLGGKGISPIPEQPISKKDTTTNAQAIGYLPKGLSIAGIIQIGEKTKPILLSTGGPTQKKTTAPRKGKAATRTNQRASSSKASNGQNLQSSNGALPSDTGAIQSPAKKNHGATWIPIQKKVGPIYFERIGASYKDGKLAFLLDASMALGGLSVSLAGLTFGSPIDHFAPYFDLHGLVIDYKKPPALEIGGGLIKVDPAPEGTLFEYDGAIVVRTKALSLIVLGSYAKLLSGAPSFFMYVAVNGLKIGPPWFMVTGLSAGFGINRRLVDIDVSMMDEFPLVSEVMYSGNTAAKPAKGAAGARDTLMAELEKLHDYIPVDEGEFFIAVGLKFTSFKIIDAFALAVVQFGHRFRIDLFGRMFLRHPPVQGGGNKLLVNVTVDMHAYVYFDEGVFGLEVDIKEGSYIYSQLCHISGRMALKSWFSGEHNGDFVFVLGGYHKYFKVPDHYPSRAWLKPLSLYWCLSDKIYVKGSFYFALTPAAIMAGGDLEANFESKHLHANFHIYADFIIFFKPFWYDAAIGVDLDVRAGIPTPFGDINIHLSLHADLHIWGPDFSGEAHLKVMGVGFSITFGAGASKLPPIAWEEFASTFLPKPEKIYSIVCEDGLIAKLKDPVDDSEWWLVNKKTFSVAINCNIPFSAAHFIPDGNAEEEISVLAGPNFGISPMHVETTEGGATLNVDITSDGDIDPDSFTFQPVYKNMPAGLWGDYRHDAMKGDQVVPDLLGGLQIIPGKPPVPGETFPVPVENLKYDSFNIRDGFYWEPTYYFKEQPASSQDVEINDTDILAYDDELTLLMDLSEMDFDIGEGSYSAGSYIVDLKVGII